MVTVCYEPSSEKAQERKEYKYLDLVKEADCNHYKAEFMLQTGSRGIVDSNSFLILQKYIIVRSPV